MKRLLIALSAVVLVVGLVVVVVVTTSGDDAPAAPQPTGEAAPEGLERFYDQDLEWEECAGAECAWVTVPIDYAEPDGETTRLRMSRWAATGDGGKELFVNPGGPGGSAIDYAATMAGRLGDDLRDVYSVVGVDPRGVGLSTPIDCLDDADFDEYTGGDPDPADDAEVREFRDAIKTFGEGCVEKSGPLAAHVSTQEAARDMDVVRALLGQEKMDWFGASYGTQLGATYATLFPDKVGAMVLDGAVDPAEDVFGSSLGQATGFQRALDAYAQACARLTSCPLGQDPEAGVQRLADLLDSLEDDPLPTGDERVLTKGRAFYGVAVTLYDKTTWIVLSQALTAAFQGDGSALLQLHDAYFSRRSDGTYAGNIGEVISAVTCLDNRERPSVEEVEDRLPEFEDASPVFGESLGWGVLGCTDWPVPAENPQVEIDAAGAPPILVLGTTRDPATPYENAPRLADQLGEDVGVLVTREGDGHTAYMSGNQCIVDAVDAYLLDGTVPEDGLTCAEED